MTAAAQLPLTQRWRNPVSSAPQGLRGAVYELLREFHRRNKRLPEVLIMYRDGVSEGQFDEVQQKEIPQVSPALRFIFSIALAGGCWHHLSLHLFEVAIACVDPMGLLHTGEIFRPAFSFWPHLPLPSSSPRVQQCSKNPTRSALKPPTTARSRNLKKNAVPICHAHAIELHATQSHLSPSVSTCCTT